MELNSCLYECEVLHNRLKPKKYKFNHKVFMFYLDLDELDILDSKLKLFSNEIWNIYSFRERDHISFNKKNLKDNIMHFANSNGITEKIDKIFLLTNVCTFGYMFNPVCFYFCFNSNNNPMCVISEVENTFLELKPYFIGDMEKQSNRFKSRQTKYFYVSPFIDLDVDFSFDLGVPDDTFDIYIDDIDKENEPIILTSLKGKKVKLNDWNLIKYIILLPLITIKIIFLIHFHALILYLKKIPFHLKESNINFQKGVQRAFNKK